jgi:soluble lytic murein transglycosylase-like protein
LALAVAKVESNFDDNALSSAGARGVMQIMPKTARDEFGVQKDELWDAALNIQIGIDYLELLYDRYGKWELALAITTAAP